MTETAKAKGMALCLGLNAVDPVHYQGWDGTLNACEADAQDMAAIAEYMGFTTTTVLTKDVTRSRLEKEIGAAAAALGAGDLFLLTYSGHGGQVPDVNGDEPDKLDETWCLYDGQFLDDEVYNQLARFQPGVRVSVFLDSCHSGTALKLALMGGRSVVSPVPPPGEPARRCMPPEVVLRTYRANRKFYDEIGRAPGLKGARQAVKATALLISGCMDNQYSQDGVFNGLFTGTLLTVWNEGAFKGSYQQFRDKIAARMPQQQTPKYSLVGAPNPDFEARRPFTINPQPSA